MDVWTSTKVTDFEEFPHDVAETGSHLISEAVKERARDSSNRLHRTHDAFAWSQEDIEVRSALCHRLPEQITDHFRRVQHKVCYGVATPLKHVWVSVDSMLYFWPYRFATAKPITLPADGPIVAVHVAVPKPGVFDTNFDRVVVIATFNTVRVVGLRLTKQKTESGMLCDVPLLQIIELPDFVVATDSVMFTSIRSTADGHIFLSDGTINVYELHYQRESGWFRHKCRLVNHSATITNMFTFTGGGKVRLLECANLKYLFTVSECGTIALYSIKDNSYFNHRFSREAIEGCPEDARFRTIQAMKDVDWVGPAISCECSITMKSICRQIEKRFQSPLKSRYITKIFPVLTQDQHVHLIAITSTGDRLRFVCSSNSPGGPLVDEERPTKRMRRSNNEKSVHFGFWLIGFSPHVSDETFITTRGMTQSERAPRDEYGRALDPHGRPIVQPTNTGQDKQQKVPVDAARWYADGVHLTATGTGGLTHSVEVRVRCSGLSGRPEPHEYFVTLPSQAKALAFAEEQVTTEGTTIPLPTAAVSEGLTPDYLADRTFVIFLADAVQVLSLGFAISPVKRAPIIDQECCGCLAMAAASSSRKPSWMWTFDDVTYPPIETQQEYLEIEKSLAPPVMARGKWFGGLFSYLSALLSPIWESPVFALSHGKFLEVTLRPNVLEAYIASVRNLRDFLRRPLQQAEAAYRNTRAMDKSQEGIGSTRSRREILAGRSMEEHGVNIAQRELHAVGIVLDRVQQVCALLRAYKGEMEELVGDEDSMFLHIVRHQTPEARAQRAAFEEGLEPYQDQFIATSFKQLVVPPSDPAQRVQTRGRKCKDLSVILCSTLLMAARKRDDVVSGGNVDGPQDGDKFSQLCKTLQSVCPSYLQAVDLGMFQPKEKDTDNSGEDANTDQTNTLYLRRWARSLLPAASEEQREALGRGLETMAMRDTDGALEVLSEQLSSMRSSGVSQQKMAELVFRVLVGIAPRLGSTGIYDVNVHEREIPVTEASTALRRLIAVAESFEGGFADLVFEEIFQANVESCLEHVQQSRTLDAFLIARRDQPEKADLLWKILLRRQEYAQAAVLLSQMADRWKPDDLDAAEIRDILQNRLRYVFKFYVVIKVQTFFLFFLNYY